MAKLDVLPPLWPGVYAAPRQRHLPFPLEEPGVRLYARGRQAIADGVRRLGLGLGDEVLAPAYHCGSEIEALLGAGLTCRYYDLGSSLSPDEAELAGLIGPRTRALYLTDYLGFPQDGERWRRWCDDHGLLLLEDAAPAWLATHGPNPAGAWADLAVFSLNKQVPVPDGAAGILGPRNRGGRPAAPGADERLGAAPGSLGLAGLADRHAQWLVARVEPLAWLRRRVVSGHVPRPFDHEVENATGAIRPPSAATRRLIRRLADPRVADRRRANYRTLLAALGSRVPPPFDALPGGASPLAFPVATARKADLLRHLAEDDVAAIDLWSVPHPDLDAARFPGADGFRRTVVGLPVHQGLRARDLDRLVRLILDWDHSDGHGPAD